MEHGRLQEGEDGRKHWGELQRGRQSLGEGGEESKSQGRVLQCRSQWPSPSWIGSTIEGGQSSGSHCSAIAAPSRDTNSAGLTGIMD